MRQVEGSPEIVSVGILEAIAGTEETSGLYIQLITAKNDHSRDDL